MAKFKVGDRVRVIVDGWCSDSGHNARAGDVYVVTAVDGEGVNTNLWCFANHEVEPVAVAPLRIQAGKFYKTRDGRKVGPMKEHGGAHDTGEPVSGGCRVDGIIRLWRVNGGKHLFGEENLDLIAEWVDEPAVAEPKFKAGDRVIATDELPSGREGSIIKVGGPPPAYLVEFDGWRDGHGDDNNRWYMYGSQLRLVAPATSGKFKVGDKVRILRHENNNGDAIKKDLPIGSTHTIIRITDQIPGVQCCILSGSPVYFYTPKDLEFAPLTAPAIVALLENGQPLPSARPFVHPDRDAAAKEAKRLAGKHKGQEFGVYELVDTVKEAKVYEHEWQRLTMDGKTWRAAKMLAAESGLEYEQARDAVFGWFAKQAA